MKTCKELFASLDCTILGDENEEVTGLAYRSDAVRPGDAFFCIVGFQVDGHTFAQDAIDRGARVIVAERRLYLADATDVCVVIVSDTRQAMAKAACEFYDNPSRSFKLVGVTGTNGKTTTTYLVEALARRAGYKTGVIGTVGVKIGDEFLSSSHTTPESPDLQRMLAQMRDAGVEVVAMEVSSHALDLERTYGCEFAVTAFTNLTQDHLDYHHTFEAYFEAKALLFSDLYPARRVVYVGDSWGQTLAKRVAEAGDELLTFAFAPEANIHPQSIEYTPSHTEAELDVVGSVFEVSYPLVGKFNVENVMCAFAIGRQLGIEDGTIVDALASVHAIPGRLQRVSLAEGKAPLAVFVDYAHTPDALVKALNSVRELTTGKLIVVFGCGGDRDSTKRPIMGRAALAADFAIVTNDNPRHEDPFAIIGDIVAGMEDEDKSESSARFEVIPDRREAIFTAINMAAPTDSVLIAGKGHEDYQIIGDVKTHFDDVEVARMALEEKESA